MTVTIYTLTDCPFCQSAKQYFQTNNIQFVEKNVENDPKALEEMQELSNRFPGVPYVHVLKDDGSTEGLKGFTKEEYDKVLLGTSPLSNTVAPAEVPMSSTPVAPAVDAVPAPSDVIPANPSAMSDATPPANSDMSAPANPLYQPEPVVAASPAAAPAMTPDADTTPSTSSGQASSPQTASPTDVSKDLEDTLQKLQDQLKPMDATPSTSSGQVPPADLAGSPQMDSAPSVDTSVMPMPETVTPVAETPPAIPDFPSTSSGQVPPADSAGSGQAPMASTPQSSDVKPL